MKDVRTVIALTAAMTAAALPHVQLDEAKSRGYVGIKMKDSEWKKQKSRRRLAKQSRKANRR